MRGSGKIWGKNGGLGTNKKEREGQRAKKKQETKERQRKRKRKEGFLGVSTNFVA